MLTTAIAALALGIAGPQTPLHCVTTLEDITGDPASSFTYGGATFGTCCGGCDEPFKKNPVGALTKAAKANKAIGAFNYDPVTGLRIDPKKAAASSDYKAIRYYFTSAEEKKTFDATPAKFVSEIKSEAYFCPVMKHETTADKAGGFADVKGVRYYICCGGCMAKFKADPAAYTGNAAAAVKALSVVEIKK